MRIATLSFLLLGTLSIPITATPAIAGTNAVADHNEGGNPNCANDLRNRAKFFHSNDSVEAIDRCSDGWGAQSEVLIIETGNNKTCYNGNGNGTTRTCVYNFGEGKIGVLLAKSIDNGEFRGSGKQVAFVA